MKALVLIYNPPELYPPTIWALQELCDVCEKIIVVTRNIETVHWNFPPNVEIVRVGKKQRLNQPQSSGYKIREFLAIFRKIKELNKVHSPGIWLAYDHIPLFCFYVLRRLLAKPPRFFWYHSHDVAEMKDAKKYTLSWLASKYEANAFRHLQLFSLPSEERKKYFRIDLLGGKCIVVPNYPSFAFYKKIKKAEYNGGPINLIYQGRISEDHFLEETIASLKQNIHGRNLKLHLIGQWAPDYQNKLIEIANREGVRGRVEFYAGIPYEELPNFTRENQVGLAIHKPTRIIYLTGGTASNKIYEYAALGLPVLLYDNEHYKSHLSKYNWSFFTSGLKESIVTQLEKIMSGFENASVSARRDFEERLHYEKVFEPVRTFIIQSLSNSL